MPGSVCLSKKRKITDSAVGNMIVISNYHTCFLWILLVFIFLGFKIQSFI